MAPPMVQLYHNRNVNKNSLLFKVDYTRCDLALALEIFYLSDGYAYLEDLEKTTDLKEWNSFITALYDDISNNKFPKTGKSFKIPLSKVQKYKLQKKGISKIFLIDL